MIFIGLDLSINSTGVCINDSDTNTCHYFIISPKDAKKTYPNITFVKYDKCKSSTDDSFIVRELKKSNNIFNIVKKIEDIIVKYKGDNTLCVLESISYGSSSSSVLSDLSGLNYATRYMLMNNGFNFNVVAPTQLKKFAVGNGSADKELMTHAWLTCQTTIKEEDIKKLKADDIADAYFLSEFFKNGNTY